MNLIKWQRLGRVFGADDQFDWMRSYAQVPRAIKIGNILRVYFSTREAPDTAGAFVSRVGYVDVDKDNPTKIINISRVPALDRGMKGSFDEFGVMPGDVKRVGNKIRMLYTGWSRPKKAPYATWIGEAFSDAEGKEFVRTSLKPVIGATSKEKILCNGPFTISVGTTEHMFYASALRWIQDGARQECLYVIMHAARESEGEWTRNAVACIPQLHELECQNAPTVLHLNGRFHLFFCHRYAVDFRNSQRGYKLGHAWSDDLKCWHRDDASLIMDGPREPWDEEMQCYPGVIEMLQTTFMFYCGNNFGKNGFGVAALAKY